MVLLYPCSESITLAKRLEVLTINMVRRSMKGKKQVGCVLADFVMLTME